MTGGGFKVTDTKELYSAKWIRLVEYTYVTPEGQERKWELCERTTRAGITDAVDVLAILKKEGEPKKIVLVKQFRPPLKGYTIEMPAGLVDAGESAETAAVRELQVTGWVNLLNSLIMCILGGNRLHWNYSWKSRSPNSHRCRHHQLKLPDDHRPHRRR